MTKGVVRLSGNSPLMMQKMWVKGCLYEGGGCLEKRGVYL
jgi:hypothetical protein